MHQENSMFTPAFWRSFAALSCVLFFMPLMNIVVFPLFDDIFTPARDISVITASVALIVLGLVATFKPAWLQTQLFQRISLGLLAGGAFGLIWALSTSSVWLLTLSACALAIGRGWAMLLMGLSVSCLRREQISVCVALACVAYYVCSALAWMLPVFVGVAAFLLLPFVAIALTGRKALPIIEQAAVAEAPVDVAVTQPSSFLPLASQLFVCLFLFGVAFGFSLRFGEAEGVPLSDFFAIIPVAIVALWIALTPHKGSRVDLIAQISVLFVVAGFFAASALNENARIVSATLLSAGNTLFSIVSWSVLIAVAGRNYKAAVATFAWGRGVTALGSAAGATLGVWAQYAAGSDMHATIFVQGLLILVFVGYALIGLKNFSFSKIISGITPSTDVVPAKTPEKDFNERCEVLGSKYALSSRELEVFMMLARGRNREYIQEKLVVSRNTVKAHVKHVYAKLGVHTQQELIDLLEEE